MHQLNISCLTNCNHGFRFRCNLIKMALEIQVDYLNVKHSIFDLPMITIFSSIIYQKKTSLHILSNQHIRQSVLANMNWYCLFWVDDGWKKNIKHWQIKDWAVDDQVVYYNYNYYKEPSRVHWEEKQSLGCFESFLCSFYS